MSKIYQDKTIQYIMLSKMKGIGPVGQHALLGALGSIDACFSSDVETLEAACLNTVPRRYSKTLLESRNDLQLYTAAEQTVELCDKKGISVITIDDLLYPDRMRRIPRMPVIIYVKGDLRINEFPTSYGIVGARRCSHEGKQSAIDLASSAASAGTAIISGMAKGIDSYAHTACIKSDGYTIAVLGNGADICYPKEHAKLYDSIICHGCILSEYPPETKPRQYFFPVRNRLIAALSDEIFVIDAGRNSGTSTTISAAEKYNRTVHKICY